jgi:PRTRC genetic system ThiF family protein
MIDTSFARAARVLPIQHNSVKFYLVGAGGTGSFAAHALARLCFEMNLRGKISELVIIDPDRVEAGNIPRSNFCAAEIGRFKAQTLAERITLAWGLEVAHVNDLFDCEEYLKTGRSDRRQIRILVGCVDNHIARREIHRALHKSDRYSSDAPDTWWIDGGNGKSSGQVLIGSATARITPEKHFSTPSICRSLPAPSLIHPELIEKQKLPVKSQIAENLSCPEMIRLGDQSLNVNQRVAVEIGEMLTELLLNSSLRRFATYFDLESGTSRSGYCTPEAIAEALKQAEENTRRKSKRRR